MASPAGRIPVEEARRARQSSYPTWVFLVIPLFAMVVQIYLPLFRSLRFMAKIDLMLLVTVYFSLMRRSQIRGLTIGLILGIIQDSFSPLFIGMYGLCKTLVGYFSASIGMQFDVEHPFVRFLVSGGFYLLHQCLYWALRRSLLGQAVVLDLQGEGILAVINAMIGVAMFHFFDMLRVRE